MMRAVGLAGVLHVTPVRLATNVRVVAIGQPFQGRPAACAVGHTSPAS